MMGNALPIDLLAQAIPMLSRHDLEALTERLIEVLDDIDGDADLENYDPDEEEDDPSGQCSEDELSCATHHTYLHGQSLNGPGCILSDGCGEPSDYGQHLKYIRRKRCIPIYSRHRQWGTGQVISQVSGHRLVHEPTTPTKAQLFKRKRGVPKRPRP